MAELTADRPLRDRLETLQREVRELKHERELPESPAFAAQRAALVAAVTHCEQRVEKLQGHVDDSRAHLRDARAALQRLELSLRLDEQRQLSSFLVGVSVAVAGLASLLLTAVPAEVCCAASALLVGWTVAGHASELRLPKLPRDGLIVSWVGGLFCVALAGLYARIAWQSQLSPNRLAIDERWTLVVLPIVLVVFAAVTLQLGRRQRLALSTTALSTLLLACCSVPEGAECVRKALNFQWFDRNVAGQAALGLLAPLLLAAFVWAHDTRGRRWVPTVLLSLGFGALAVWCSLDVAAIELRYWRSVWGNPMSLAALSIEAALGTVGCALALRGRWKWLLVALGAAVIARGVFLLAVMA